MIRWLLKEDGTKVLQMQVNQGSPYWYDVPEMKEETKKSDDLPIVVFGHDKQYNLFPDGKWEVAKENEPKSHQIQRIVDYIKHRSYEFGYDNLPEHEYDFYVRGVLLYIKKHPEVLSDDK
jgi:hypothetical protein